MALLWRNLRSVEKRHKLHTGQNYYERKQIFGGLCDRIEIGWTCITCCEVNIRNKRTLVPQETETLDLVYKQFI